MRCFPAVTLALLAAGSAAAQAGASVEGQVVDAATNAPVRKAIVALWSKTPGQSSSRVQADFAGRFAFGDLQPGSYSIDASANGYGSSELAPALPGQTGGWFPLAAGQKLTGIVIRLTPSSAISGRVLDEDGDPLSGVEVVLMRANYWQGKKELDSIARVSADDRGRYRLANVAAGKYYLSATLFTTPLLNRSGIYVQTFYPGALDPATATPIALAAGTELENMNLKMTRIPTVRVRGQLMDVANPDIRLIPDGTMANRRDYFARIADGKFEFSDVPAGQYNLLVSTGTQQHPRWVRRAVTVGTADVEDLTIALPPAGEVEGRVVVEGEPQADLSKVTLRIVPAYPNTIVLGVASAKPAADGSFRIADLAPDRYRLAAFTEGGGLYLKSLRSSGQELPGQIFDLGGSLTVEVLLSRQMASVSGRVQGEGSGQPAAGATVVLIPQERERREDPRGYQHTTTDEAGRFTIRDIVPGDYRAYAWVTLSIVGEYMDPDFVRPVEGKSVPVSLPEAGSASIELTAIPAEK
jgi:protocatechuate 3,4-dioxygenase beta subunit